VFQRLFFANFAKVADFACQVGYFGYFSDMAKRKPKERAKTFEVVKDAQRGWRLSIPARLSDTGKRRQFFYQTSREAEGAAKGFKARLKEFGAQAIAISPGLSEQATAAADLLKPWGLSILDAARMAVAVRERETASKPLGEAADLWLLSCEGLRPKTIRGYGLTADKLRTPLGGKLLAGITAEELQAAIAPPGTAGAAAAERVRNCKAFWNWSASKGWCDAAIFAGVEMPRVSKDGEIEILTVAEAEALLRTAEKHFPQAVASFALQLFAGIRVEEITRLDAEHVTQDGIELAASVTKRGRRRHIALSATLAAWLERYPFEPCANWRETSAAVRRLCGWDVVSVILNERLKAGTMKRLAKPHRGRWPQNALRHSHASYSIALGVPLESLLFEFGHSGGPALLRQHYLGRASKREAIEFFKIAPEGVEIPNLAIA